MLTVFGGPGSAAPGGTVLNDEARVGWTFLPLELSLGRIRIGGEIGFSSLLVAAIQDPSIPYTIGPIRVPEDRLTDREMFMSFSGVAQLEPGRYLFLQAGDRAQEVTWFHDYD